MIRDLGEHQVEDRKDLNDDGDTRVSVLPGLFMHIAT